MRARDEPTGRRGELKNKKGGKREICNGESEVELKTQSKRKTWGRVTY